MQAMKKVQLLTCLPSPPRPKKEITGEAVPRSRAQNFSQQTVASDCKGCASNIQMTACTLMDPVQVQAARKRGRGAAVFSLFDGEHGRNAVVQCTQVIIEWLDKSGANGANYSNEAAKSVSDCVTGRANGTERRRDAERPKLQSKHRKLEINCYCNNGLPLLKEMEEGKPRDTMLWKLSIKRHQRHQ